MRLIKAKFHSRCAETGRPLIKGDEIYFDTTTRKAYHKDAPFVKRELEHERRNLSDYIQAQEDAYLNNITGGYYLS
jgi:hypothetical protein